MKKEDFIQGWMFAIEVALFFLAGFAYQINIITSIFCFLGGFIMSIILGKRMEKKAIEYYKEGLR